MGPLAVSQRALARAAVTLAVLGGISNLIAAVFPADIARVKDLGRRVPWRCLGWGLALFVAILALPELCALAARRAGSPAALSAARLVFVATVVLLFVILPVSFAASAAWTASWLGVDAREHPYRAVNLGGAILLVIGAVPRVAWAAGFLMTSLGLGMVAVHLKSPSASGDATPPA